MTLLTVSRSSMCARPMGASVALMIVTVVSGLAIRFAHLGQTAWVAKFGGSALWAAMIYWVLSTAIPSWRIPRSAFISGMVATAVELLKLYDPPWMDAFRRTLAGIILLGRIFNPWDIAVYWIAILAAAALDHGLRRST